MQVRADDREVDGFEVAYNLQLDDQASVDEKIQTMRAHFDVAIDDGYRDLLPNFQPDGLQLNGQCVLVDRLEKTGPSSRCTAMAAPITRSVKPASSKSSSCLPALLIELSTGTLAQST